MSTVQRVAQLFGAVFILVGLIGFFNGSMNMSTGLELGLFPVNVLHNCFHVGFGIWGLMAARTFAGAKMYAQAGGIVYILLAIIGFAAPNALASLMPLGGNDVWLHLVLGVALVIAGYTASETAAATA